MKDLSFRAWCRQAKFSVRFLQGVVAASSTFLFQLLIYVAFVCPPPSPTPTDIFDLESVGQPHRNVTFTPVEYHVARHSLL